MLLHIDLKKIYSVNSIC